MLDLSGCRVLVITHLGFQRAGNQSFRQAIWHYVRSGARVIVLTSLPQNYGNQLALAEAFGTEANRVEIVRFPSLFRPFFFLARMLKNLLKRNHPSVAMSTPLQHTLPDRYSSRSPQGYDADLSLGGEVVRTFSWFAFQLVALFLSFLLMRRHRFNLVVGQEIYGAAVAACMGRLFDVPVVNRFQGTLLFHELRAGRAWRYPHHVWGLRSRSSLYVMTNDGTRGDEVLVRLGVDPAKIRFWLNGFSFPEVPTVAREDAFRRWGIPPEARLLLCVNKLKFWKRIDRAVHALAELRHTFGHTDSYLIIAGDGPERPYLEQLARNLGVGRHVQFLGAIPHAEVFRLYPLAEVFIVVNDVSNLSNPLMEAMYFGCPIVSLADESTAAFLRHGENAWLVDPTQTDSELPKAIDYLLRNESERRSLGEAARRTAQAVLRTWEDRMAAEITEVRALLDGIR